MTSTRFQPGVHSAEAVGARRATRGSFKHGHRASRGQNQRSRGRVPSHRLLLACTGIVALGLLAALFVNAALSQGAFRQHELEIQLIYAAEKEEALARKVQVAEAPATLERKALALGMVPAGSPVFLDLSSGKIRGEPVPAPSPTVTVMVRPDELTAPPERLAKQLLVPAPSPAVGATAANPGAANPAVGNPAAGNPAVGNPAAGNPAAGNPAVGQAPTAEPSAQVSPLQVAPTQEPSSAGSIAVSTGPGAPAAAATAVPRPDSPTSTGGTQ